MKQNIVCRNFIWINLCGIPRIEGLSLLRKYFVLDCFRCFCEYIPTSYNLLYVLCIFSWFLADKFLLLIWRWLVMSLINSWTVHRKMLIILFSSTHLGARSHKNLSLLLMHSVQCSLKSNTSQLNSHLQCQSKMI